MITVYLYQRHQVKASRNYILKKKALELKFCDNIVVNSKYF